MEKTMFDWAISQGIGAVLALVMFLIYRKDVKNGLSAWRAQTEILIDLTGKSTRTNQELVDVVHDLRRQLPIACPILADRREDRMEDGRDLHWERRHEDGHPEKETSPR